MGLTTGEEGEGAADEKFWRRVEEGDRAIKKLAKIKKLINKSPTLQDYQIINKIRELLE